MSIINGDCLEVMKSFSDDHFTTIITDPPYGLSFMNKGWDHSVPSEECWQECLRVSKPGTWLLAMGGTRTYHRLTRSIEDAGWQIRDCLMWIYCSGFPKSKGCLKPAYEPIIMARKKGPNLRLNIDECRIPHYGNISSAKIEKSAKTKMILGKFKDHCGETTWSPDINRGRWPANVMFDEEAAAVLDEQSSIQASRFFYCAKASSSERNEGLDKLPLTSKNYHPTVKPLKLMEYLIKLVMPLEDGLLLDPFAGSGTTILAAKKLGFEAIGIEKEESYCRIARERIENLKIPEQQLELFI